MIFTDIKNGRFYNEDCFDAMREIPDGVIPLLLTDIPYNEVNRKSSGLRNLNKGKADIINFELKDLIKEFVRIVNGSYYIFVGFNQISPIIEYLKEFGVSSVRLGVWEKTNPSPMNGQYCWLSGLEYCVYGKNKNATFNEHCKKPLWKHASTQSKIHPTQKPVKLFEELIKASSNEGDCILDPFGGSGTTAIAAINTNRKWVCIEKDETYYSKAVERITNHAS